MHDIQKHRPVLAFSDRRHIELAKERGVINTCQTADFVVVLHALERELWRHFHDAVQVRLLIAGVVTAVAEATLLLVHEFHLTLQLFRNPPVVAVAEGDVAPLSMLDGVVAAIAGTTVLIEKEVLDVLVFRCVALKNQARVVGGVVVRDNQLPVRVGLAENTLYAFLHEVGGIIRRHDNRYKVFFQHSQVNEALQRENTLLDRRGGGNSPSSLMQKYGFYLYLQNYSAFLSIRMFLNRQSLLH